MDKRLTLCLIAGGAAALAATQAQSHHGWAGQGSTQFELSGTLHTPVSFAGPHATMQIRDDKGQVWDLTLSPPNRTLNAGLTEDAIPVGAAVTVSGHRNSDPERFEIKTERVTYGDTNFDVYPNRT